MRLAAALIYLSSVAHVAAIGHNATHKTTSRTTQGMATTAAAKQKHKSTVHLHSMKKLNIHLHRLNKFHTHLLVVW